MRCQDCKMISFESCATYGSFSGICLCNATLGKRWQQELNYWSRSSLQQTLNMKKSACLMTTKALLRAKVILRCCDPVHAFELRWIKLTRLRSRTISLYHPTNAVPPRTSANLLHRSYDNENVLSLFMIFVHISESFVGQVSPRVQSHLIQCLWTPRFCAVIGYYVDWFHVVNSLWTKDPGSEVYIWIPLCHLWPREYRHRWKKAKGHWKREQNIKVKKHIRETQKRHEPDHTASHVNVDSDFDAGLLFRHIGETEIKYHTRLRNVENILPPLVDGCISVFPQGGWAWSRCQAGACWACH